MTRWGSRFRVARRTVLGLTALGVFVVIGFAGAMWRASAIVNRLLREWAAGTIAEQSGGVYQLELGRVRFDWALRRVAVDSMSLTTRRGVNDRRLQSLPGLRVALYSCTISGVHFITLVRNAGLIAGSFGCRQGSLAVEVPRPAATIGPQSPGPAPAGPAFGERPALLAFQQGVRLPAYAPRIRIAEVVFPRLALDLRLPSTATRAIRFGLERLQWNMTDLVIDPADTSAAARPLFSRKIELVATNFTTHPDRVTELRVDLLRTSLTDSTLEIRGVAYAPSVSGAQFARSRPSGRDLITLKVAHITAQGIDVGAFIVGQGIRARRIEVDSFRIDVTSDKRLPAAHAGPRHLTPQQWIANLDETLSLDSLEVRNGDVVYREHAAGRENAGVFSFARLKASATNLSHFVGRRTSGDPMILTARAQIQGAGQLDVGVVVPLDAPQFDMTFGGTLGVMAAPVLNSFLVETQALQIQGGQVTGVVFGVAVKNGVARGTITPRFNDLSISVMRSGSTGLLGGGGITGSAARRVVSFAAKQMMRADNPDRPASSARVGTIRHAFRSDETLIAFLWSGLRDGMLLVVKR